MAFDVAHSSVALPGAASFPRALWLEKKAMSEGGLGWDAERIVAGIDNAV